MDIFSVLKINTDSVEFVNLIKGIGAIIMTFLATALGGVDNLVKTLTFLVIADIVLGILGALYTGKFNSELTLKGLIKKFAMFIGIAVMAQLDTVTNIFELEGSVRDITVSLLIAYEMGSLIESWSVLGLPLPEAIKTRFVKYNTISNTDMDELIDNSLDESEQ